MARKKLCRKLTKEQKKLVWGESKSNAGVGWESPKDREFDVDNPEERHPSGRERDTTPRLDEVLKEDS